MSTFAPSAPHTWVGAAPTAGGAPRPLERRDAAFFDLDNTIVRGASIFHLARGLYRRRCFTARDLTEFAARQVRFRILGAEGVDEIATATNRALDFVRGLRQDDVVATGEQIYDEVLAHKLWTGTVDIARSHLDAGHQVWLVTAAPHELATLIARRLGFTGGLGTVAEVVDGVYTGALVGSPLHGSAKAEALRAVADREGLDLSRCAAYSDSANDLPMLGAVGHPCAVNPDRRLAMHALRHGWATEDFRGSRRVARFTRASMPAVAGVGAAAVGVQLARHRAR
jgi:HAD superfamily hydrolase (TIGR01490 family)